MIQICVSETQGVKELSIEDVPVVSQPERLRSCLIWGGMVISVSRCRQNKMIYMKAQFRVEP